MTIDSWRSPEAIKAWWASPSQSALRRPYTAEEVAALRDVFPEASQSNELALKLRGIFEKHRQNKTINIAMSVLDAVSLQMMAEEGFETAYVSGALISMTDTPTNDPGTDLADYPYDAIPKKVKNLFRSQLLQSRVAGLSGGDPNKSLMPIIADADSGHGFNTATMKLVKLMVQSGASGFHIDDLLSGTKRFDRKDGIYYVVVPVSELVRRLTATRLQLDIMGSEAVIIARSDVEMGSHVTSTVDPRDRPYVLGATVALPRDYSSMPTSPEKDQWLAEAKLASLDDAFKAAQPKLFEEFTAKTQGLNVSEALRVANTLAPEFYWSTDAARTIHGWYPYRGCVEAAIDRVLACADVADVLWSCVRGYDGKPAEQFSTAIHKVHPGKWLAYNVTGGFPADGSMDEEIKAIPQKLASLGYVWQFLPMSGITSLGLGVKRAAREIKANGLFGYIDTCSRPAAAGPDNSVEWWWKPMGKLTDAAAEAIGDGLSKLSSAVSILSDKWGRQKPKPEAATTPWPALRESNLTFDVPASSKLASIASRFKDRWIRRGSRAQPNPDRASTFNQPSSESQLTFDRRHVLTSGTGRGRAFSGKTVRSVFREDLPLDRSKGNSQLSSVSVPSESPSISVVDDSRNPANDSRTSIEQTREEDENAGTWAAALSSLFLGSKSATSHDGSLKTQPPQTASPGRPLSDPPESQDHDWWRRVKEAYDEGRKLLPALLGTNTQESLRDKHNEHAVIADNPSTIFSSDEDLSAASPRTRELGSDHSLTASSAYSSGLSESWSNVGDQGTPLTSPHWIDDTADDLSSNDSSEFLEAKDSARAWWSKEFNGNRRLLAPSARVKRLSDISEDSGITPISSGEDEATLEEARVVTFQSLESLQSLPSLQEVKRPDLSLISLREIVA
ncbi:hypothetical protein JCM24511_03300 [Saitozyma sp. JCM 24511]|nr:hypothetical protein JCM24511_03300 [Saitozyma sp. JCM 24511]